MKTQLHLFQVRTSRSGAAGGARELALRRLASVGRSTPGTEGRRQAVPQGCFARQGSGLGQRLSGGATCGAIPVADFSLSTSGSTELPHSPSPSANCCLQPVPLFTEGSAGTNHACLGHPGGLPGAGRRRRCRAPAPRHVAAGRREGVCPPCCPCQRGSRPLQLQEPHLCPAG